MARHRATYHRTGGVRHFLAAYDLETGHLCGQFTAQKTWEQWLAFLQWIRARYRRTETPHIVLDNYGSHLKAEVLQWAHTHNIKFYFTPTNVSWLNHIEGHFAALKKLTLDNFDHRNHSEPQAVIESHLDWYNDRRELAVAGWLAYRKHTQASSPCLETAS